MDSILRYSVEQSRSKQPTLRYLVISALKSSDFTKGETAYDNLQARASYTDVEYGRDGISETIHYLLDQIGGVDLFRQFVTEDVGRAVEYLAAICEYEDANPHDTKSRSTLIYPEEFHETVPHGHKDDVENAVIEWESNPWDSREDMLADARHLHAYATTGVLPEEPSEQFEDLLDYGFDEFEGEVELEVGEQNEDDLEDEEEQEPEVVRKIRDGQKVEPHEIDERFRIGNEYGDLLIDALILASENDSGIIKRGPMKYVLKNIGYASSSQNKYSAEALKQLDEVNETLPLLSLTPGDEIYTRDMGTILQTELDLLRKKAESKIEISTDKAGRVDGVWMGKVAQRNLRSSIRELQNLLEYDDVVHELEVLRCNLSLIPDSSPAFSRKSLIDIHHPKESYNGHPHWDN